MAKHKKKPDSELELVSEPIDEEPALVEEEGEPELVDEAIDEEPALVEEEGEPDLVEEAIDDEPALVEEADEPATVEEEDEPAVVAEDDDQAPASLDSDDAAGAFADVDVDEPAEPAAAKDKDDGDELVDTEFEPEPEPGLTMVNLALIVLNVLAAVAFAYLLMVDYGARHKLQRAAALISANRDGLDVDEKEGQVNARRDTNPRVHLSSQEVKESSTKLKIQSKSDFQPAKVGPGQYVPPSERGPDFNKELFGNLGRPVTTLKEELKTLENDLPEKIKTAAADAGKKGKAEAKESLVFRLLMPLARTGDQVVSLEKKIQKARGEALELDKLLKEAAQRRLLADVLIPMEDFRFADWVGDDKKQPEENAGNKAEVRQPVGKRFKWTERFGELDDKLEFVVNLEKMEKLLKERFTEALADKTWESSIQKTVERRSIEKRQYIAFFLLVIDRLVKPDELADPPAAKDKDKEKDTDKGETPNFLYPDGLKRLQILVGQRDFTQACDTLARIVEKDEPRIVTAIERDRGTYLYPSLLENRLRNPGVLAEAVLQLLKKLEIKVDDNDFKKQVTEFLADKFKDKVLDLDEFMKDFPNFLTNKLNIAFADDVQKTLFNRELFRLIDPREQGFVGRYQEMVQRLRDIAAVIEDRKLRLEEVIAQEKNRAGHYQTRVAYAKVLLDQVVKAREKTLDLAQKLRLKQDELNRAQRELAWLALQNLDLERQIRQIEGTYKGKRGKQ